jgi:hypothetical protein
VCHSTAAVIVIFKYWGIFGTFLGKALYFLNGYTLQADASLFLYKLGEHFMYFINWR